LVTLVTVLVSPSAAILFSSAMAAAQRDLQQRLGADGAAWLNVRC
jgi:hypothetical protein